MITCSSEKENILLPSLKQKRIIMKRTLLSISAVLLMLCTTMSAMAEKKTDTQMKISENKSVVIYYMPKTVATLTVEYEQVTLTKGIFYQYSERYLGTTDVITSDETTYNLLSAKLATCAVADEKRHYSIDMTNQMLSQYEFSLTPDGRLVSINTTVDCDKKRCDKDQPKCDGKHCSRARQLPPMLEEQQQANSVAKMAGVTAKQIYHIREARQALVAGEADHAPADGKALELSLKTLDEQEQALVELFIGKREVKRMKQTIEINPAEAVADKVLLRFSKHSGIVAADDLSGEPVFLNVKIQPKKYAKMSDKEAKKQKQELSKRPNSGFYYNLPGNAEISLTYNQNTLIQRTIPVAQLGVAMPLPQLAVKQRVPPSNVNVKKTLPFFVFDPTTGALLRNGHVE